MMAASIDDGAPSAGGGSGAISHVEKPVGTAGEASDGKDTGRRKGGTSGGEGKSSELLMFVCLLGLVVGATCGGVDGHQCKIIEILQKENSILRAKETQFRKPHTSDRASWMQAPQQRIKEHLDPFAVADAPSVSQGMASILMFACYWNLWKGARILATNKKRRSRKAPYTLFMLICMFRLVAASANGNTALDISTEKRAVGTSTNYLVQRLQKENAQLNEVVKKYKDDVKKYEEKITQLNMVIRECRGARNTDPTVVALHLSAQNVSDGILTHHLVEQLQKEIVQLNKTNLKIKQEYDFLRAKELQWRDALNELLVSPSLIFHLKEAVVKRQEEKGRLKKEDGRIKEENNNLERDLHRSRALSNTDMFAAATTPIKINITSLVQLQLSQGMDSTVAISNGKDNALAARGRRLAACPTIHMDGTLTEISSKCTLSGQVQINVGQVVWIKGVGAERWRITAATNNRHFRVLSHCCGNAELNGQLNMENIELYGGYKVGDAVNNGGSIDNYGTLRLTDCTFTGNFADGSGGAIYIRQSATVTVTNCIFTGNTAASEGGAICIGRGTATLTSCIFTGNTGDGGQQNNAIRVDRTTISMRNCIFNTEAAIEFFKGSLSTCTSDPDVCSQDYVCRDRSNSGTDWGVTCVASKPWISEVNSSSCSQNTLKHIYHCPDVSFTLTINGLGLGQNGSTVTVGGMICSDVVHLIPDKQIICSAPAAIGSHREVVVTRLDNVSTHYYAPGFGNEAPEYMPAFISTHPPKILFVDPQGNFTSAGRSILMLTGQYFGQTFHSKITANIDGKTCTNTTWLNHSAISTVTPVWGGHDIALELFIDSQVATIKVSYARPVITRIIARTAGGNLILFGNEFGGSDEIPLVITSRGNGLAPLTCLNPQWISISRAECMYSELGSVGLITDRYLSIAVNGYESEPVRITYDPAPQVFGIEPSLLNPLGGDKVTITGEHFGPIDPFPLIFIGVRTCRNATWISDSVVTCIAPPNVGKGHSVIVSRGAKSWAPASSDPSVDVNATVTYSLPIVSTINPTVNAKVNGGDRVTIHGKYFGEVDTSRTVTIGGQPCNQITFFTHERISCVYGPGGGKGLNVEVTVASQVTLPNTLFHYGRPLVTVVVPSDNALVKGGNQLIVQGAGFGLVDLSPTITVGGRLCSNPVYINTNQFVCTYSSGVGKDLDVLISIHNQTNEDNNRLFGYQAPVVDDIEAGLRNASGGYPLVIEGRHFGTFDSKPVGRIGSHNCSSTAWVSDTQVRCIVPPGSGVKQSIQIYVANQLSSPNKLFDYAAPVLVSVHPNTALKTTGGEKLVIQGANFGTGSPLLPSVTVGAKPCINVDWISDTKITCLSPKGIGQDQILQVTVSDQSSPSHAMLTYAIPEVLSISPATSASIYGGDKLTINGKSFGTTAPNLLHITIGSAVCDKPGWTSDSEVYCTFPAGGGTGLDVVVNVAGQHSIIGNALFSYAAPAVLSILPPLTDPGGGRLVVKGEGFGRNPDALRRVLIEDVECQNVTYKSNTELECIYPPWDGNRFDDLDLQVQVQHQISAKGNQIFSYNIPGFDFKVMGSIELVGIGENTFRANATHQQAFKQSLADALNIGTSQIKISEINGIPFTEENNQRRRVLVSSTQRVEISYEIGVVDVSTARFIKDRIAEPSFEQTIMTSAQATLMVEHVQAFQVSDAPQVAVFNALTECGSGHELSNDRTSCVKCVRGRYKAFVSAASCVGCMDGGDCDNADGTSIPLPLPGWYREHPASTDFVSYGYHRCPLQEKACPGLPMQNASLAENATLRIDMQCSDGYAGVVCGICDHAKGYVLQAGECQLCAARKEKENRESITSLLLGLAALGVCLLTLGLGAAWLMTRPALDLDTWKDLERKLIPLADKFEKIFQKSENGEMEKDHFCYELREESKHEYNNMPFQTHEIEYIFDVCDDDNSGTISWTEFQSHFGADGEKKRTATAFEKGQEIKEEGEETANGILEVIGSIKVLFGFAQCLGYFPDVFTIPWPSQLLKLMAILQSFSVDLFSVFGEFACTMHMGFLRIFAFHAGAPLAILVTLWITNQAVTWARKQRSSKYTKESAFAAYRSLITIIIFAMYPGLSSRIFRVYKCDKYDDKHYLSADISVKCFSEEWWPYAVVGFVCLGVYVVGIPAQQLWVLGKYRYYKDVGEDGTARCGTTNVLWDKSHPKHRHVFRLYGTLYENYKDQYYYFDLVDLVRKTLLVGGLVFVQERSVAQLFLGTLICFGWTCLLCRLEPYRDKHNNAIAQLLAGQLTLTLVMATVKVANGNPAAVGANDPMESKVLDGLLVFTNLICAVIALLNVAYSVGSFVGYDGKCWKSRNRKPKERDPTTKVVPVSIVPSAGGGSGAISHVEKVRTAGEASDGKDDGKRKGGTSGGKGKSSALLMFVCLLGLVVGATCGGVDGHQCKVIAEKVEILQKENSFFRTKALQYRKQLMVMEEWREIAENLRNQNAKLEEENDKNQKDITDLKEANAEYKEENDRLKKACKTKNRKRTASADPDTTESVSLLATRTLKPKVATHHFMLTEAGPRQAPFLPAVASTSTTTTPVEAAGKSLVVHRRLAACPELKKDGTLIKIMEPCTLRGQVIIHNEQTVAAEGVNQPRLTSSIGSNHEISRHFLVKGGELSLRNVELYGGQPGAGWPYSDPGPGGASILLEGGTVTLVNCIIAENVLPVNKRDINGGAIYMVTGTLKLTGCSFINNGIRWPSRYGGGGAIYMGSGMAIINSCRFINNVAHGYYCQTYLHGGGVYIGGGNAILSDCVFTGNSVGCCTGESSRNWMCGRLGQDLYIGGSAKVALRNCEFPSSGRRLEGPKGGTSWDSGMFGSPIVSSCSDTNATNAPPGCPGGFVCFDKTNTGNEWGTRCIGGYPVINTIAFPDNNCSSVSANNHKLQMCNCKPFRITLNGTKFGAHGTSVLVNNRTCTQVITHIPDQLVSCLVPQPENCSRRSYEVIVVTAGGKRSDFFAPGNGAELYSYIPTFISLAPSPIIISAIPAGEWSKVESQLLVIRGHNFRTSAVAWSIEVYVNGQTCNKPKCYNSSYVTCESPIYAGKNLNVELLTGGLSSGVSGHGKLSYPPPTINSIQAPLSPTSVGGELITIYGTNLGRSSSPVHITIDGQNCTEATWTSLTTATCITPTWSGLNLDVVLTVGGQNSNSTGLEMFTYAQPKIDRILAPTAGGGILTILGSELGGSRAIEHNFQIWSTGKDLADVECSNPTWVSFSMLTCTYPENGALDVKTNRYVQLWIANLKSNSVQLTYDPKPTVLSLHPPVLSTVGEETLTITGKNFGAIDSSPTVTIDQHACTNAKWINDSTVICITPPGIGLNKNVVVNRGEWAPATSIGGEALADYRAPIVSSVEPSVGAAVSGNETLNIYGMYFGTSISKPTVTVGGDDCIQATWLSNTFITCVYPAGGGINLDVVVTIAGQASTGGNAIFGYGAPKVALLVPATDADTQGNNQLQIRGIGFGKVIMKPTVIVGGKECSSPDPLSNTLIACQYPAGTGGNLEVFVTVMGQTSSPSDSSKFSYKAPVVSRIRTIDRNENGGAGGYTIRITGKNFGVEDSLPVAFVGGQKCLNTFWNSSKCIDCVVPPGSGAKLSVTVNIGNQENEDDNILFSYDAPVVSAATPSTGIDTQGGTVILFSGQNFGTGDPLPTVTINEKPCSDVKYHSIASITCKAPAGAGEAQEVILTVDGQASVAAPLVAYAIPHITSISPAANALVEGGELLTISGSHFGSDDSLLTVEVGGEICTMPTRLGLLQISCVYPSGGGKRLDVTVIVAGQRSTSGLQLFSYGKPRVSSLVPEIGDIHGGTMIVKGHGFGRNTSSLRIVQVGEFFCVDIQWKSNEELECAYPAYSKGKFANLKVVIGIEGQFSDRQANVLFRYNVQTFAKKVRGITRLFGLLEANIRSNMTIQHALKLSFGTSLNVGSNQVALIKVNDFLLNTDEKQRRRLPSASSVDVTFEVAVMSEAAATDISNAIQGPDFISLFVSALAARPATATIVNAVVSSVPKIEDFDVKSECPAGLELSTDKKSCILCKAGSYKPEFKGTCVLCMQGGDCRIPGTGIPLPLPGFYRDNLKSSDFTQYQYHRCPLNREIACPGMAIENGSLSSIAQLECPREQCGIGYTGIVCGICDHTKGYVLQAGECQVCAARNENKSKESINSLLLGLAALALCLFTLGLGAAWLMTRPALDLETWKDLERKLIPLADKFEKIFQKSKNGELEKDHFCYVLRAVSKHVYKNVPFQKHEIECIFHMCDDDNSGTISWTEFQSHFGADGEKKRTATTVTKEQEKKEKDEEKVNKILEIVGSIKVLFGFAQCLGYFPDVFTISWPSQLLKLMAILQSFSVDLFSVFGEFACTMHMGFLRIVAFHAGAPLAILATLWVTNRAVTLARKQSASKYTKESAYAAYRSLITIIIFAMYPGLSSRIFRVYKCDKYDDKHYLSADISVKCFSEEWWPYAVVGFVCLGVYVVGIPAQQLWVLRKYRYYKDVGEDGTAVRTNVLWDKSHPKHRHVFRLYGTLYENYKDQYYYFDLVDLVRKTLLVGGLVFVQERSVAQLFLGTLICFGWTCLLCRLEPYRDKHNNAIAQLLAGQLTLTLVMATVKVANGNPAAVGANDPMESKVLDGLLVFTNLICAVIALLNVAYSVGSFVGYDGKCWKSRNRKTEEGDRNQTTKVVPVSIVPSAGGGSGAVDVEKVGTAGEASDDKDDGRMKRGTSGGKRKSSALLMFVCLLGLVAGATCGGVDGHQRKVIAEKVEIFQKENSFFRAKALQCREKLMIMEEWREIAENLGNQNAKLEEENDKIQKDVTHLKEANAEYKEENDRLKKACKTKNRKRTASADPDTATEPLTISAVLKPNAATHPFKLTEAYPREAPFLPAVASTSTTTTPAEAAGKSLVVHRRLEDACPTIPRDGTRVEITAACTMSSEIRIGDAGSTHTTVNIRGVGENSVRITAKSGVRHFELRSGGYLVLENVELYGGNAWGYNVQYHGGAIFMGNGLRSYTGTNKGGTAILSKCSFTNNYAYFDGGAIYMKGGTAILSSCSFTGNSIGGNPSQPRAGPDIFASGTKLSLRNSGPVALAFGTGISTCRATTEPRGCDGFDLCYDRTQSGTDWGTTCTPSGGYIKKVSGGLSCSTATGIHATGCTDHSFVLTINGSHLGEQDSKVYIGNVSCLNVTHVIPNETITCLVPPPRHPHFSQRGEVVVVRTDGFSTFDNSPDSGSPTASVTYQPIYVTTHAPVIVAVTPNQNASTSGNQSIVVTAKFIGIFAMEINAWIDGKACSGVRWINSTALGLITPPYAGKDLNITIVVDGQNSGVTGNSIFSYNKPRILHILPPAVGSESNVMTILGEDFGGTNEFTLSVTAKRDGLSDIICTDPQWKSISKLMCNYPDKEVSGTVTQRFIYVGVYNQVSDPVRLVYDPIPTVSDIQPSLLSPLGGDKLVIVGTHFGLLDSSPTVEIGGKACTNATWVSDKIVTCLAPPNVGNSHHVIVSRGADSWAPASSDPVVDVNATVDYAVPVVTAIDPASDANVHGNERVHIYGKYFGAPDSPRTVAIGGQSCTDIVFTNHSMISCVYGAGGGKGINIVVTVASQTNEPNARFNYGNPVVSVIVPSDNAVLEGGNQLIVQGAGFGLHDLSPAITVGGNSCADPTYISTNQYVCNYPPGVGKDLDVLISIHGQMNDVNNGFFSYLAPVVDDIAAGVRDGRGGYNLTISGANFGTTDSKPVGRIGPHNCTATEWISNTQVRCTIPPGSGLKQSVQIYISNQVSAPNKLFDYAAPTVSSVHPSTNLKTTGGTHLEIHGANFGVGVPFPTVKIGSNNKACLNIEWVSDNVIKCVAPSGIGRNQAIQVAVHGQTSSPRGVLGYAPPTVLSIDPTASADINGGKQLTITGNGFGVAKTGDLGITIGSQPCNNPIWISDAQVQCTFPPGGGEGLNVIVTVAGQENIKSNQLFGYGPPKVSSMLPTKGDPAGGPLAVKGEGFGHDPFVLRKIAIGATACVNITYKSNTELECIYEAWTGGKFDGLDLVVQVQNQTSTRGGGLFSYNIARFDFKVMGSIELVGIGENTFRANATLQQAFKQSLADALNIGTSQIKISEINGIPFTEENNQRRRVLVSSTQRVEILYEIGVVDVSTARFIKDRIAEPSFEQTIMTSAQATSMVEHVQAFQVSDAPQVAVFNALTECGSGHELSNDRTSCIKCARGRYKAFVSAESCVGCMDGGDCDSADGTSIPLPLPGWYREHPASTDFVSYGYHRCPLQEKACPGLPMQNASLAENATLSIDTQCSDGYAGVVCGICDHAKGYVLQAGECQLCAARKEKENKESITSLLLGLSALGVCLFTLGLGAAWLMTRPALDIDTWKDLERKLIPLAGKFEKIFQNSENGEMEKDHFCYVLGAVSKHVYNNVPFQNHEIEYIFHMCDDDNSGTISWMEFQSHFCAHDQKRGTATASEEGQEIKEKGEEKVNGILEIVGSIKVLFGFAQCLGYFPDVFTIPWPSQLLKLMAILQSFSVDLFSVFGEFACTMHMGFLRIFAFHAGAPLAILATLWVTNQAVTWAQSQRKSKYTKESAYAAYRSLITIIIFAMYPGLSSRIFRVYKCDKYDDKHYLSADLSVKCFSEEWWPYAVVGFVCLGVYVVGIPAQQLWVLRKYRYYRGVSENGTSVRRNVLWDKSHPKHRHVFRLYGTLYENYKDQYYYFDLVDLVRKTLLVGGLVFVQERSVAQLFLGTLICFGWTCLLCRLEPYRDKHNNAIAQLLAGQLTLTLVMATVKVANGNPAAVGANDPMERKVLDGLLVFTNLICAVIALLNVAYSVGSFVGYDGKCWKSRNRKTKEGDRNQTTKVVPVSIVPSEGGTGAIDTKIEPVNTYASPVNDVVNWTSGGKTKMKNKEGLRRTVTGVQESQKAHLKHQQSTKQETLNRRENLRKRREERRKSQSLNV